MSLLEVVVALGVLSIISAIVIPIFQNYREETRKKVCHRNFAMIQEAMRSYAAFNKLEINASLGWATFIATDDSTPGRLLGASARGCDFPARWYTFYTYVTPIGQPYVMACGNPQTGSHAGPANTTGW